MPNDIVRVYPENLEELGYEYYITWNYKGPANIEITKIETEEGQDITNTIGSNLFNILIRSLLKNINKNE
jgi:hypothetical protein